MVITRREGVIAAPNPRKRRMKLYHCSWEPRGALTSQLDQKHLNMLKCRLTDQSESINTKMRPISQWLGALAKLRKATASFIMSVRLYVRPYGTTRLLLDEFSCYLMFAYFPKICEKKIKVSWKSDKNNGYFSRRLCAFMAVSRSFLLRMRNVSDQSVRENQNTFYVQ